MLALVRTLKEYACFPFLVDYTARAATSSQPFVSKDRGKERHISFA
jgi:hypothetical protein